MRRLFYKHDVFISHAIEDKVAIANELYECLSKKELKIWYSGRELSVGDQIDYTILKELKKCRYGIVIISPIYLTSTWALREFDQLLLRQKKGRKVILPVLYNITPEELATRAPWMADIFAIKAERGIEYVVEVLYSEIITPLPPIKWLKYVFGIVLILLSFLIYTNLSKPKNKTDQTSQVSIGSIESAVQKRVSELQNIADQELKTILSSTNAKPSTADYQSKVFSDYKNIKSYFRNEYDLSTGYQHVRAKKNVDALLQVNMENLTPFNSYQFVSPDIYASPVISNQGISEVHLFYRSTQPVTYTIETENVSESKAQVHVSYANNLRLIHTTLIYPSSANRNTKRHHVDVIGCLPKEAFSAELQNNAWVLTVVK